MRQDMVRKQEEKTKDGFVIVMRSLTLIFEHGWELLVEFSLYDLFLCGA